MTLWELTPAEFFVMVEGARERARDEAWRFAHVVMAGGAKIDADTLTRALELAPKPVEGDDVDDLESMAGENRRRRAERVEAAWRRRLFVDEPVADIVTALTERVHR